MALGLPEQRLTWTETISAPASANAIAMAAPIPRVAPVTRAVLPARPNFSTSTSIFLPVADRNLLPEASKHRISLVLYLLFHLAEPGGPKSGTLFWKTREHFPSRCRVMRTLREMELDRVSRILTFPKSPERSLAYPISHLPCGCSKAGSGWEIRVLGAHPPFAEAIDAHGQAMMVRLTVGGALQAI